MRRAYAVFCIAIVTGCGSSDASDATNGDASSLSDAEPGDAHPIFAPSCQDDLQNGDESDVDCGGGCAKCAAGKRCTAASDCAADSCKSGRCLASSCRALHDASPMSPSGAYELHVGGSTIIAYCDMTSAGGGWALAMKVDGAATTWAYANAVWTDDTQFGTTDPSESEAKLAPFTAMPFTQLRVVMRDAGMDRALVLAPAGLPPGSTLRSVFASGKYYATSAPRTGWLGLVASGSLQTLCNQQGLNNTVPLQTMRIGIFGNQEANCDTCDSRLGIGYGGPPASGNNSSAAHDDSGAGGRATTTFSFVWVR